MSCLYRALSYFHDGIATEQMRNYLCNYLSSNPQLGGESADKVIPWETRKSLAEYVRMMRSHHQWGGAIEIKAYCDLFNTNVKVISYPNQREIEFISSKPNITNWNTISWNGVHYEPVRSNNNQMINATKQNKQLQSSSRQYNPKRPQRIQTRVPNRQLNNIQCNCPNCQRKRLGVRRNYF